MRDMLSEPINNHTISSDLTISDVHTLALDKSKWHSCLHVGIGVMSERMAF